MVFQINQEQERIKEPKEEEEEREGEMAEQKRRKSSCEINYHSKFSLTCSLLSQYWRENRSFGSIGLDMSLRATAPLQLIRSSNDKYAQAPITTLSLLPGLNAASTGGAVDQCAGTGADQEAPNSLELFPQKAGMLDSPVLAAKDDAPAGSPPDSKRAQLTIFYGGKVLVFDDFPAARTQGLLHMAREANATSGHAAAAPPLPEADHTQANISSVWSEADMPIARKNSLHRFLEKRKGRISTKGPYQVPGEPAAAPEGGKPVQAGQYSWLGLGREAGGAETRRQLRESSGQLSQ